jgi:hypothetical protein
MWAGNRAAVGQWAHHRNSDDDVIVLFRFGDRCAWTCFGVVVAAAVTYDVLGVPCTVRTCPSRWGCGWERMVVRQLMHHHHHFMWHGTSASSDIGVRAGGVGWMVHKDAGPGLGGGASVDAQQVR